MAGAPMSVSAYCQTCGGRIYRPEVLRGHLASYWLHTHREDWIANPHDPEPREVTPDSEPETSL